MEVAHGQIYFYCFYTGRTQKMKEVERVRCRCAQLVHCHLHGIPLSEGWLRRARRSVSVTWPVPGESLSLSRLSDEWKLLCSLTQGRVTYFLEGLGKKPHR